MGDIGKRPEIATNAGDGTVGISASHGSTEATSVRKALYPTPQSLARILNAAVPAENGLGLNGSGQGYSKISEPERKVDLESLEAALSQILQNAFEAMDSMYFST